MPRAAARSRTLFEQSEVMAAACGCQNTTFDASVNVAASGESMPRAHVARVDESSSLLPVPPDGRTKGAHAA